MLAALEMECGRAAAEESREAAKEIEEDEEDEEEEEEEEEEEGRAEGGAEDNTFAVDCDDPNLSVARVRGEDCSGGVEGEGRERGAREPIHN
jgi:hypothetical protein